MGRQPCHLGGRVTIGVIADRERIAVAILGQFQRQFDRRHPGIHRVLFKSQPSGQRFAARKIAQLEHGLEHLWPRVVARQAQRVDDLLEWGVLVCQRRRHGVVHAPQLLPYSPMRFDAGADRDGIDECADQRFQFDVRATGDRYTDADIVGTGVPVQQDQVGGEQNGERRRVLFLRQAFQRRLTERDGATMEGAPIGPSRPVGAIAGQFQQGHAGELSLPIVDL